MSDVDAKIDNYFASKSPEIEVVCRHLRDLILAADSRIEPCWKWGMPHYDFNGLMCGIGGFKKHVSLFFHRGAEMSDPESWFEGQEKNETMRTVKLHSMSDIDDRRVIAYVQAAVKLNATKPPTKKKSAAKSTAATPDAEPSAAFQAALAANPEAAAQFASMAPYKRKEYCQWINGAKRDETKTKRIAQAVEMIAQGLGKNDKYRR